MHPTVNKTDFLPQDKIDINIDKDNAVIQSNEGCSEGQNFTNKQMASEVQSKYWTQFFFSPDYHVGGNSGWSAVYSFIAKPLDATWSPVIAVYGDMGNVNGQAISYLQKDAQRGAFDFVLHIGMY